MHLVKQKVSHPLRDDDIDVIDGQDDFLHLALDQCDGVSETVGFHDLLCLVDDVGHVNLRVTAVAGSACNLEVRARFQSRAYADDLLGSGLGSKHAQDSRSASNIENNLIPDHHGNIISCHALSLIASPPHSQLT